MVEGERDKRKPAGADRDTATRVLDVAERLVQTRGFNGFSYGDVAAELGVTTAALHYHFPGKAELGSALVDRYTARFVAGLAEIDAVGLAAPHKLHAYADLYLGVLRDDRMCLCGMLAAEYRTLPAPMQTRLLGFFDQNEDWLTTVLEEGRSVGSVRFDGDARAAARAVVGALEGAMLVARPYGDADRFRATAFRLIESLVAPGAAVAARSRTAPH